MARRIQKRFSASRTWPEVPASDGFYENLGCDIVHFPSSSFTVCAVPSIYNPHDLQHLHFPQFFSPSVLAWREAIYRAACHFARAVVVNSQWVKDDVVQQYGISPKKVQVIPEGPATHLASEPSAEALARTKERHALPESFAFFPGVNWPHKNHLRLLDALAHLRDHKGLVVPLVCSGSLHMPFWAQIESRIAEHGLTNQVQFLGFVPEVDLRCLYRLARCLILPTLFEANSLPIFEAWLEGTPVACSNVTALPEQVADAGILFDPLDHIAIGDALSRLFADIELCEDLGTRGRRRLQAFDWQRTARAYRAVYRRTAGHPLSDEDRMLLESDWMRNSCQAPSLE
jgi:glycosyltransferase involved in cell wall biosynthesis